MSSSRRALVSDGETAPSESQLATRLAALLQQLEARAGAYPSVIAVRSGDQYPLIRVEDIDWLEAEGNYVRVHARKTARLISRTLTELEARLLDPARFVRIHRGSIVNLSRIVSMESLFHGELSVKLVDGTRLTCSRRFRKRLQERIYFTS